MGIIWQAQCERFSMSSKWLLFSTTGACSFPHHVAVQPEHLHTVRERWMSANWCNEAISLWGWAVLNKQEQQGRVLHGSICGSTLATSTLVFTTLIAGRRTKWLPAQWNNSHFYGISKLYITYAEQERSVAGAVLKVCHRFMDHITADCTEIKLLKRWLQDFCYWSPMRAEKASMWPKLH